MTIYLDIILLENLVLNYLIIYVTGIISKAKIKQLRIILGSMLGAIFTIISYIVNLKIYSNFVIKIVLSVVIIYISFNSKNIKQLGKQVLLFYLVSFVFAGATIGIIYMGNFKNITIQNGVLVGNYTLRTILVGVVIAYFTILLSYKLIKTKISKKDLICDISIKLNNKEIKAKAMLDTGNLLKEPITNTPVIVMEHTLFKGVLPKEILDNIDLILGGDFSKISKQIQDEYISKLRVIPFSSLGKQNGLLLGIKGENLKVNLKDEYKKIDKVIIGIYNKKLTHSNEYTCLIGLNFLN